MIHNKSRRNSEVRPRATLKQHYWLGIGWLPKGITDWFDMHTTSKGHPVVDVDPDRLFAHHYEGAAEVLGKLSVEHFLLKKVPGTDYSNLLIATPVDANDKPVDIEPPISIDLRFRAYTTEVGDIYGFTTHPIDITPTIETQQGDSGKSKLRFVDPIR